MHGEDFTDKHEAEWSIILSNFEEFLLGIGATQAIIERCKVDWSTVRDFSDK